MMARKKNFVSPVRSNNDGTLKSQGDMNKKMIKRKIR